MEGYAQSLRRRNIQSLSRLNARIMLGCFNPVKHLFFLYLYVKNKCFFISKKQNILANERK